MDSPIVAAMPAPPPPPISLDNLARERIKAWLESTGMTQVALAAKIDKNQAWLSRYLAGDYAADLATLQKFAAVFGQSLTALLSIPASDPIETRLIEAFRALTPKRRAILLQILDDWVRPVGRGAARARRE